MDKFKDLTKKYFNKKSAPYIVIVVSSIVTIVFAFSIYLLVFDNKREPGEIVSKDEKEEILENIIKNNSTQVLESIIEEQIEQETSSTTANDDENEDETETIFGSIKDIDPNAPVIPEQPKALVPAEIAALDPSHTTAIVWPDFNKNNYSYSKTVRESGPSSNYCGSEYYGSNSDLYGNSINEYFDYYDPSGKAYTKSLNSNLEGELNNFNLSKFDSVSSQNYLYQGGNYGIKFIYNYTRYFPAASYPNSYSEPEYYVPSYPVSYNNSNVNVVGYFGSNVKIVDKKEENGIEYYILEWVYYVDYCGDDVEQIIYHNWVNTKTFDIYKAEKYVNSITDDNNIYTISYTTVKKKVQFSEVSNEFEFDYDVPLRELDYKNYDYTHEKNLNSIANYLANNNFNVIEPSASVNLSYIYATDGSYIPAGWDYYKDRNFYPQGDHGEMLYKIYSGAYPDENSPRTKLYSVYKYQGNDTVIISMFNGNVDFDAIVTNRYYYYPNVAPDINDIVIDINGTNVSAKEYEYKFYDSYYSGVVSYPLSYGYPSSYALSYPSDINCESTGCFRTQKTIVFEYAGNVYSIYSYDVNNLDEITFKSLNTQNAEDMEYLRNEIVNVNN